MTGRSRFALTAAFLLLALPARESAAEPRPAKESPPAAAPTPPSLAETLTDDAKSDYQAAKVLYGDRDFAGALVKFTNAYEKSKDARLLWNIAACEKNLRHYASVLFHVRKYMTDGDLGTADRAEAEELIAAIEPFTADLEVNVSEPGAKVYVDDVLVGAVPLDKPIVVDIGVRKIRVVKDGFADFIKELPVGGAKTIHLDVTLTKVVHEGTLIVNVRPKDEVFVDGLRVGVGSWRGTVSSGGHMLRVTAPEMRAYQSEVLVRDNETRTVAITLDREPKPSASVPTWVWIGGGALVLAGAAVGAYFLFKPADKPAPVPIGNLDPGNVQASIPALHFH